MILLDYIPYIKIYTIDHKNIFSENLDDLKKLIANQIRFFTVIDKTKSLHVQIIHSKSKFKHHVEIVYGHGDKRYWKKVQLTKSGYNILHNIIAKEDYVYKMFKDNLSNDLLKEIYKEINS